jgi:hypothetical protein
LSLEQLLPLLLGPVGVTVGALFVVFMFSTDRWVSGKRLAEALRLLDRALDGNDSIAQAMAERNALEKAIVARSGGSGLSAGLVDAERAISRPRRTRSGTAGTGSSRGRGA